MPYIGNDIRANVDYKTIDDISGSFNGSPSPFALQVGGAAPTPFPKYETQLIISVGGVVQEPDSTGTTGFQLSGTNIVFSSAPASGESFFGVLLASADYLNAGGTFPDGTASVPSITFTEDTDTGFFRVSSGQIGIVANGTKVAQFPTATGSSGQLLSTNGAGVLSYVDAPSGATGGGSDKVIIENGTAITTNYTIGTTFGATCNAGSFGPITINAGVTLTIPSGSVYTVV
jgi:hypothetical protein